MRKKTWVKLDNASKIFLATYNKIDTKVFRISTVLEEQIDADLLQEALNATFQHFNLYHSIIRRGVFWYYLEDSDLQPKVEKVYQSPCRPIYKIGEKNLLFRVTYLENRIHLEVFHALSDGTGAMWFLEMLLYQYLKRRYPEAFIEQIQGHLGKGSLKQQMDDSFTHYFGYEGHKTFGRSSRHTFDNLGQMVTDGAKIKDENHKKNKVYHVRGLRTPDKRMRCIEALMPAKSVLALAKQEKTTLTVYLTALFMLAVFRDAPRSRRPQDIAVSIPINLRQYFKSASARNFFATMRVQHTFYPQDIVLEDEVILSRICRDLEGQFEKALSKETLEAKVQALRAYEDNLFIRMTPRLIKDSILKFINHIRNRELTIAISNLGLIRFGEDVDTFVKGLSVETSAIRPQFCAVSHGNVLSICFTSPFIETEIQKNMIRMLTHQGIEVTVSANRVDEKTKKEAR